MYSNEVKNSQQVLGWVAHSDRIYALNFYNRWICEYITKRSKRICADIIRTFRIPIPGKIKFFRLTSATEFIYEVLQLLVTLIAPIFHFHITQNFRKTLLIYTLKWLKSVHLKMLPLIWYYVYKLKTSQLTSWKKRYIFIQIIHKISMKDFSMIFQFRFLFFEKI